MEVKSRMGRLGTKLRVPLSLCRADIDRMAPGELNRALLDIPEIAGHMRRGMVVRPTLGVDYRRQYFAGRGEVRLTLDEQITFTDLGRANRLATGPRRALERCIVEFKFAPTEKDTVVELMTDFPIYPSRSSKYVDGLRMFGRVAHY